MGWKRRASISVAIVFIVAGTLAVALTSVATTSSPTTMVSPSGRSFGAKLGIYVNGSDPTSQAAALGISKFPFLMEFITGTNTSTIKEGSPRIARHADRFGARLIAPFNMLPDSGVTAAQAAAGAMNATATSFAQGLVANGQPNAIIRIGWEMNGGWFPWGTQQMSSAQFLAIWHQEVTSMKSVAGENFKFYWNPIVNANNTCSQWLPPAGEVDVIGLDVYDQTNGSWPGAATAWQSYLSAPCGLNYIASTAQARGLQIGFGEWGLGFISGSSGGDDPYFISQFAAWCQANPVLFANVWDDGNALFSGSFPQSVAALKAAAA